MNEWLQEGEHSKYQTPEGLPKWAWLLIGLILGFVIGFIISPARASESCMTHAEAREVWPNTYLHWRGEHCWSGRVRSAHAEMRSVPLPKPKPFILLLEQPHEVCDLFECRWWLS